MIMTTYTVRVRSIVTRNVFPNTFFKIWSLEIGWEEMRIREERLFFMKYQISVSQNALWWKTVCIMVNTKVLQKWKEQKMCKDIKEQKEKELKVIFKQLLHFRDTN